MAKRLQVNRPQLKGPESEGLMNIEPYDFKNTWDTYDGNDSVNVVRLFPPGVSFMRQSLA